MTYEYIRYICTRCKKPFVALYKYNLCNECLRELYNKDVDKEYGDVI